MLGFSISAAFEPGEVVLSLPGLNIALKIPPTTLQLGPFLQLVLFLRLTFSLFKGAYIFAKFLLIPISLGSKKWLS